MKKLILILILTIFTVCISNAQEIIRSLKTGEWELTLEEDVTYTIEPIENSIIIKEGEINLHSFDLPNILTFSSDEPEYITINGVKWAKRNLAAHGQFVENPEDNGALFQWGRKGDGHEQYTSSWYIGPISGSENFDAYGQIVETHDAYGKFIAVAGFPSDWRSPQKNDLWNLGSEPTPIKSLNDPCPDGWRLPTHTELNKLGIGEWTDTPVAGYRFGSGNNILFLPAAGYRFYMTTEIDGVGTVGYYWSSTIESNHPYHLFFKNIEQNLGSHIGRANAHSVRCVVE